MKIDYISDLHLDCVLDPAGGPDSYDRMHWLYETYMANREGSGEILVIAGDLGHFNSQNLAFLRVLGEYYSHIVIVSGNHDLYLPAGAAMELYRDSFERLNELQVKTTAMEKVHFLNGNCIEVGSVKIAGSGLWYDYSFGLLRGESLKGLKTDWARTMNDAKKIVTLEQYASKERSDTGAGYRLDNQKFAAMQKSRLLDTVRSCRPDLIVSHIPPLVDIALESDKTGRGSDPDMMNYYYTDTREFGPYVNGKVWICGHTHNRVDMMKHGCRYLANPFGYYEEDFGREVRRPIRSVEISGFDSSQSIRGKRR